MRRRDLSFSSRSFLIDRIFGHQLTWLWIKYNDSDRDNYEILVCHTLLSNPAQLDLKWFSCWLTLMKCCSIHSSPCDLPVFWENERCDSTFRSSLKPNHYICLQEPFKCQAPQKSTSDESIALHNCWHSVASIKPLTNISWINTIKMTCSCQLKRYSSWRCHVRVSGFAPVPAA